MKRFDVYLVVMDPAKGKEIRKTRPAAIISPDEMNDELGTVIIAPMTTNTRQWQSRVFVKFASQNADVILDQIRSVDKSRLKKKLGKLDDLTSHKILRCLQEMFS